MSSAPFPRIHPTAVIAATAELAQDVQVGPYTVIEDHVRIGSGTIIGPHVHLAGPLSMGQNNRIHTGAVLGGAPQHLKYANEPTGIEIGDNNVFREHVTVHRGTTHSWTTRIGHGNFLMAHSHLAHDCVVGNNCILANGAQVAGHVILQDNAYLSGNSAVHQFVRIGRLALLSGASITTKDIPPFVTQQGINCVVGVNVVGCRRAGMTAPQINAVRRAYHILYGSRNLINVALHKLEEELGNEDVVQEMIRFIKDSGRGINLGRDRNRAAA